MVISMVAIIFSFFFTRLGSKFDGNWENDRINGEGTSWYPNGNKYQGEWSNGRINGRGKLIEDQIGVIYYRNVVFSKWRQIFW